MFTFGGWVLTSEQVPTLPVSAETIMSQPEFSAGVADARAGRSTRPAYDDWGVNEQWNYERGRLWARLTPRTIPLKISGQISPEALRWFTRHGDDIL
jgi:hypothetical protein